VPVALLIAAVTIGNLRTWVLVALLVLARLVWDVVATFSSVLYAFDRFRIPNVVETVRRCLLLAVVVVLIVTDAAVEWAAIATLVLCILGSSAIIRPALHIIASKTAEPPASRWSDAAWFWLNGVLFWINAEVDQLLLSWLSNDYQTGIYAAAVRLVLLCLIIPRAVNDTVIRRWFRAGSQADTQMAMTTLLLSAAGGLIGLQFVIFPREIINLVYSARYADSAPCFVVLGAFVALHFARCAPTWFIATSDRVPLSTAFFALAAVSNFVANLWLIPRYGALGASYATTGSELLLLGLAYSTIGRGAPKLVVAAVLGFLPALLALGVSLLLRAYLPWYVACFLGLTTGAASMLALGKRSLGVLQAAPPA
jgi:O-antigen/teichoic acid export membrane protein